MLQFMDYVQNAFYLQSGWNHDNFYGTLTGTANALLDFKLPHGLNLNVSSLSSKNFASSYTINTKGNVDGSFSYLYTSLPLQIPSESNKIYLRYLIPGYRRLAELVQPEDKYLWEIWHNGKRIDKRETLLYGRIFLPSSSLQALYLRHLSPSRLLRLSCVSNPNVPNSSSILAVLQQNRARYSLEYLYSTDSSLLGIRGLYNFKTDERDTSMTSNKVQKPALHHHGRLSAGGELYFSPINKSGGMSTAVRFSTLPSHSGFPYTLTMTLNPLMGNISSSYAVKACEDVSFCSRFNFNFYSYESDVQMGMELWRRKRSDVDSAWAEDLVRTAWKNRSESEAKQHESESVLKARVDQDCKIGVLWEGRMNDLLISAGVSVDLKNRTQLIKTVGLEVSYSS